MEKYVLRNKSGKSIVTIIGVDDYSIIISTDNIDYAILENIHKSYQTASKAREFYKKEFGLNDVDPSIAGDNFYKIYSEGFKND